jgi:dUTP pyrophosphatase
MKIKKLTPDAKIPTKAHPGDLGFDLYASEDVLLNPDATILVSCGIAIQFPYMFGGVIKDRSSMAMKGILTCGGVIDNGYRGPIGVMMRTMFHYNVLITKGQKIAQLILVRASDFEKIEEVDELDVTVRGSHGFGSTGV